MFWRTLLHESKYAKQTHNHTLRRRPKTNLASFTVNSSEALVVPPTDAKSIFDTISVMISLKAK